MEAKYKFRFGLTNGQTYHETCTQEKADEILQMRMVTYQENLDLPNNIPEYLCLGNGVLILIRGQEGRC